MIYYTGDTHGDMRKIVYAAMRFDMTEEDTVVILGDAGLNYYGNNKGDTNGKKKLSKTPVTTLCIHGNHEMRPETISTYKTKTWHGGTVFYEEDFPHILFARDGEIYDLCGKKTIVIGGAYSVDKYFRLQVGHKWFPDEQPSEDTKKKVEAVLENIGWKIDQVLNHTCPAKYIPTETFLSDVDQSTVDRSTEEWLDKLEDKLTYSRWLCGHWHIDKSIDKLRFVMNDFII